jgi:hypothetical protein
MKKASDSAKDLAKKKAAVSRVTSNIPSSPSSFNSGKGLPEPPKGIGARGYKTTNKNPYESSSTGGSISGLYNAPPMPIRNRK